MGIKISHNIHLYAYPFMHPFHTSEFHVLTLTRTLSTQPPIFLFGGSDSPVNSSGENCLYCADLVYQVRPHPLAHFIFT